ncbi:MAG: helix-turn-helix transcriptional regulator [Enterobacteriaceae bacterium]
MNLNEVKFLLKPEVKLLLRVKADSSLQEMVNAGEFPKPVRIGLRRVGWLETDVNEWLKQRIAESQGENNTIQ